MFMRHKGMQHIKEKTKIWFSEIYAQATQREEKKTKTKEKA